jgi:5-methylcytosine-specific restriction protein A
MPYGFEVGRIYNRRSDIHVRFGGQQQGGIITPSKHPMEIVITGEAGLLHGYTDQQRADGVFEYFGEGQKGDMELARGNAAIAHHAERGKDLLMFRKEGNRLRFMGEWVYSGHRLERGKDTDGNERQAIVFELTPLEDIVGELERDVSLGTTLIDELRRRAFAAAKEMPGRSEGRRNVYERSRDVRDYVVARAKGQCEGCDQPAPFLRPNGTPYLEPHHLRRLSDGGPDDPKHVIAVCPTCHRRVHCGADGDQYNRDLSHKMLVIEPVA